MAGTGSRTLKLSILADVADLTKGLNTASKDTQTFGDKIADFSKKAGIAFAAAAAAAGAYAIKIGVDGVKAAIADEQAQLRLATALKAATGASDAQVASTEKFITSLATATGVADDKLRPAMQRLALSTNDVKQAQDLLDLSTKISINTGKDLEGIATAIAKAQDGQSASLAKLGIGLSAAELKGMSFNDILAKMNDLYPDLGANADSFAFKMGVLKNGLDEAKESIGAALLPALTALVTAFNTSVLPVITKFTDALAGGGADGAIKSIVDTIRRLFTPILDGLRFAFNYVRDAVERNKESFEALGSLIKNVIAPVLGNTLGVALKAVGVIFSGIIDIVGGAIDKIMSFIRTVEDMVNRVISAYNRLPTKDIGLIGQGGGTVYGNSGGAGSMNSTAAIVSALTAVSSTIGATAAIAGAGTGGAGGSNASALKALDKIKADAAKAQDLLNQYLGIDPNAFYTAGSFRQGEAATMVTVNFNGVIGDNEQAARVISDVLTESSARGGVATGFRAFSEL